MLVFSFEVAATAGKVTILLRLITSPHVPSKVIFPCCSISTSAMVWWIATMFALMMAVEVLLE